MKKEVFITQIASYLPNNSVGNDEMENYLGLINGEHSRVKHIVLKQNGIKKRYYALDTNQNITHTNAEMAGNAINKLINNNSKNQIGVLACATSTPDQLLPSHASMVHGYLKGKPLEIYSLSGVCLTSLQALKVCYHSILCEEVKRAICCASELTSPALLSKNYNKEYELCKDLNKEPYMAFEKDFMRFMLSDGAGAVLLEDGPYGDCNLKIEWIDICSYANELPTCMFMASELRENGELKSWKEFAPCELIERSVFVGKQNIRTLKKYIIKYWVDYIAECLEKHSLKPDDVTYIIPHVSSMFFYDKLNEELIQRKINLDEKRWFTNLSLVGNIGSAAIFVGLEGLLKSKQLKKDDKILLLVPESGRFSFGAVLLTVY